MTGRGDGTVQGTVHYEVTWTVSVQPVFEFCIGHLQPGTRETGFLWTRTICNMGQLYRDEEFLSDTLRKNRYHDECVDIHKRKRPCATSVYLLEVERESKS